MSERYNITASALGSYFGVGFNTPYEQLMIDLGLMESEFDDDSMDRMRLGTELEDAVLNYFEYKLKISITNRNLEVLEDFDGKLRLKIDGETIYNGEPTIVECKVSNSTAGIFTKNKGYLLQTQAYMNKYGYNQCLLLGLYLGKPVWTLVKRDDEAIEDIEEMVETVFGILNGLLDESDFPYHLTEKYSGRNGPDEVQTFDEDDLGLAEEYAELAVEYSNLGKRLDEIKDAFKEKYSNMVFKNEDLSVRVTETERKGFLDEISLEMSHPDIDLDKYRKPSSKSKRITITKKKGRA